jgi:deoxyribonuclease IV
MKKRHSLLLGAHMSIAGELYLAIERGESIGCTAIQIFTKSNRQWHAKAISEEEINAFKTAWKNSSIQSVIAHAAYLVNIGSADKEIEKKSIHSLEIELNRCSSLGIPYLVLHPGSYGNSDEDSCLERISTNISTLLTASDCTILLEIMAGQGSSVGHTFEQIAQIIKYSEHKNRIGVCFDTCHAFAAGYDFRTEKTYNSMWEHFDKVIGINKLKAIHINDSQKDIGSRVDRHADIGKGKIGLKAFELLFNDPIFFDIPKVLETPKNHLSDYKKNMETLINLLSEKTYSLLTPSPVSSDGDPNEKK